MITEIPTAQEFHDAGLNQLYLAWETATNLLRQANEKYTGSELDEVSLEEYWEKSRVTLGNAFSLIQQAMELGIKGRIAAVSPFILIAQEHRQWPMEDSPFSEFRTVDAVDLIRVHNAIATPPFDDHFRAFFDDVRRKRNRLMHSVPKDVFEPGTLILNVLKAAEALYGAKPWSQHCLELEAESRIRLYDGGDNVVNDVMSDVELALEHLQPAEAERFFGIKKQRTYLCPSCYAKANRDYGAEDFPKMAQLRSKTPGETQLDCRLCGGTSTVERADCGNEDCKGNVLDDERMCLTCQHDNYVGPVPASV